MDYLEASLIPIADEKIKLSFGHRKGYVNDDTIVDSNRPISATGLVEARGWKIGKGSNLVLDLENISPVCLWLNLTIGSRNSILP